MKTHGQGPDVGGIALGSYFVTIKKPGEGPLAAAKEEAKEREWELQREASTANIFGESSNRRPKKTLGCGRGEDICRRQFRGRQPTLALTRTQIDVGVVQSYGRVLFFLREGGDSGEAGGGHGLHVTAILQLATRWIE